MKNIVITKDPVIQGYSIYWQILWIDTVILKIWHQDVWMLWLAGELLQVDPGRHGAGFFLFELHAKEWILIFRSIKMGKTTTRCASATEAHTGYWWWVVRGCTDQWPPGLKKGLGTVNSKGFPVLLLKLGISHHLTIAQPQVKPKLNPIDLG